MSDYYNIIDSAEKIALKKGLEIGHEQGLAEGLEQGLEQGRAEGREEGLLLAARNMLSRGLPIDVVVNVTGLSEDMVRNIHD